MRSKLQNAEKYIKSATEGKRVGKLVQAACGRHIADIEKAKDKSFPYYHSPKHAQEVIEFCSYMTHHEGSKAGTPLILDDWQQAVIWQLFGWRRKRDDRRRYTKLYMEVGRKNGKTFLMACLAMYAWLCEGEGGAKGYCAATDEKQARLAWNAIAMHVENSKELSEELQVWKESIVVRDNPTMTFSPLSSDERRRKKKDGLNPHVVVIDEYHEHRDGHMLEVMESAMMARSSPLTLIITTAGNDLTSACYKERGRAARIATGGIKDEEYLSIIYSLDPDDDWTKEENWIKANPGLYTIHEEGRIAKRIEEAIENPAKTNAILRRNLNMWMETDTRWLPQEKWNILREEYTWADMMGRDCIIGIDLSAVRDVTALCYCFLPVGENEPHKLLWRYWVPESNLDIGNQYKEMWEQWEREAHVEITEGNAVRYEDIIETILEDSELVNIREIAYDPYHSSSIIPELEDHFPVVPVQQNYKHMAPLTNEMERAILTRAVAHDGNPVSAFMFSCMEMKKDRQENKMPMRPREAKNARIDGIVAAIMAFGRAVLGGHHDDQETIDYDIVTL